MSEDFLDYTLYYFVLVMAVNFIVLVLPFVTCFELFLSVTSASRGYAFVEYETEREMLRAYKVFLMQHDKNEYDNLQEIICAWMI